MSWLWFGILFLFIYLIVQPRYIVHGRWQERFDNLQISVSDFYDVLTTVICEHNIQGVRFSKVTRSEGGFFTPRRECLRITYRGDIYDVCVAPFGSGCYISWWQFEKRGIVGDLLRRSKTIETILDTKPEYHTDAVKVFKEIIHSSIHQSLEHLTTPKGLRSFGG